MKSFNIFVDCHVFDGNFQGTTTYLKGIYLEMIKDKDMQFFFAANDLEKITTIFGKQENVHYLKYKYHNKFYRLLIDIPILIKQHKIDYAHFQYIVPPLKYCKYINTIHDVLFLDFPEYFPLLYRIKNKYLFKWSAQKADIVLTVSEFSKNQIQKHFNIQNVQISPNAVDSNYFQQYDKTKIKQQVKLKYNLEKYWLYISRWEPRKNHHTLLKVFVENKFYNDYSLVFIGDKAINNTMYNDYYGTLTDEIKAKIVTLNKVDFEQLLLLLRGANLSVYPSFAEGFGIPPLESVAARIPTACSNTTAMADFKFMKGNQFDPNNKQNMLEVINKTISGDIDLPKIQKLKDNYNWTISALIIKRMILKEEA
ncbi:glycosyltransferase family 1 protein [Flavobacterium sp. SUN052]|uniref:glycosyltransferase family 4 protein n=1 Tax=Flavobacterium sp. SUN052 TaxID=3002441 RepID=UPI00237E07F3|nr:glycosyltransferase family 1 protein [Flavobacterium sp. SUN052]MEC4003516.1 glycosyltransferase family 1 protein [Flavobacterium sp. SUN052]